MTTVTLPREVVEKAELLLNRYLKETPLGNQPHMIAFEAEIAVKNLRAALDAPANPPCQMCKHYAPGDESNDGICLTSNCTDFDKFKALPPVVLTKVTK